MIYILPTRHDIQLGLSASPKKLITHISNLIKEHSIDFVTEEVHPDELIGDSISPIGRFTFEKDVSYTYLDPSIREESEISMPTPQQVISEPDETKKKEMQLIRARKGEDFWLPRIIAINESYSNILLICGANHVSTNPDSEGTGIDRLLQENKVEILILDNYLTL